MREAEFWTCSNTVPYRHQPHAQLALALALALSDSREKAIGINTAAVVCRTVMPLKTQ